MGLTIFLIGLAVAIVLASTRSVTTALMFRPMKALPPRLEIRGRVRGMASAWTTGDPIFDKIIAVDGEERWLAAALGVEMRRAIAELASRASFSIENGSITVRTREAFEAAALLASQLSSDLDVQKQIAINAKSDPIPEVRRRCLAVLIRDHAPMSKDLAAEMISDPDPMVRLLAAQHVGARAAHVFWALASDRDIPARVRIGAIAEFVRYETFDEVRRGLEELLEEPQPSRVMAAIAKGVAEIGGDFERHMIKLVAEGDEVAQVEATLALGRIGTIASVEPLLSLLKRSDLSAEVRVLAKRTIAEIQSAARGEGGQLSISEADGGELSTIGEES